MAALFPDDVGGASRWYGEGTINELKFMSNLFGKCLFKV